MGLRDAMTSVVTAIRALVPISSPDWPYVCEDDGGGVTEEIARQDGRRTRWFELQIAPNAGPRDDGEASPSGSTRRMRCGLVMEVTYERNAAGGLLETRSMVAEDLAQICDSLGWDAASWDTTVDAITPPEPASYLEADTHIRAGVAFDVIYREAI